MQFLNKPHKYGKLSSKHNVVVYTSILETIKPYLMNTIRVNALQTLMLCCRFVDTSRDFSRFIFDQWIEVQMDQYIPSYELRSFLQNAIIVRSAFDKRTADGSSNVKFLDKLARFLATDVKYYIGRLGPIERKSLVEEEKAVELDSDILNLQFVENCSGWLKIGTVESIRLRKNPDSQENNDSDADSDNAEKQSNDYENDEPIEDEDPDHSCRKAAAKAQAAGATEGGPKVYKNLRATKGGSYIKM